MFTIFSHKVIPILFLFLSQIAFGQWNPDAGLIVSYTANSLIQVSSGENKTAIVDGDLQSYWESTNPLPSNYIANTNLNIFLDKGKYVTSPALNNLGNAFDGVLSSKALINNGKVEIQFINPTQLFLLSVKMNTTDLVTITVVLESGIHITKYDSIENYSLKAIKLSKSEKVKSIKLECATPFEVFEIAGLFSKPTEEVLFDFGKTESIGWISSRHFNGGGVLSISVLASIDKKNWYEITTLDPRLTAYIQQLITPQVLARYIKVIFVLVPGAYKKAKLLEFNVYDSYGSYGKPLPAHISKKTYSQSFGINAIWGWGYSVYSDQLTDKQGPKLYNKVAHLARNYHSINWDIKKPRDNPRFENMAAGKGTSATSWLNWDREYEIWKSSGFDIDACIMFNNKQFHDTLWHNTQKEAKYYGKYFANHFSKNTPLVSVVEVGNEPWDYSKTVYRDILDGMSLGIKQNASNLVILPCAVQAFNPGNSLNNYISSYIVATNSSNLDGLNTHIYSYIYNENGGQSAVSPEDRRSEVWSINNLQRFALANMNAKPIYVTEFGYDSDGGGDDCTHDVCVTEFEQAIFGTRMALILFRLGVNQFYWYYFANVDYTSMKHNRSGLTSSYSKGMQQKKSFNAFELLQKNIGNYYFHHIISENEYAYIYAFSDASGKIRSVVAWRPTSTNHTNNIWVSFPFNYIVEKVIPLTNNNNNMDQISYVKAANELKISLSGIPVIILIKD